MAISFNAIPNTLRTPFVAVEIDNSNAQQGASIQERRILAIGQRLAAGTEPELTLKQITSVSQARDSYGRGSIMAQMVEKILDNNKVTELTVISQDDDGGSVKAVGEITFSGSATAAGTVSLAIGGRRVRVAAAAGGALSLIVTDLVAAITADPNIGVVATVGAPPEKLVLTAKNGGLNGNDIDLRFNLFDDEELPAGISQVTVAMAGGSANPDITAAIALLGETQYTDIAMSYTDSANLIALDAELEDRWGPLKQNDGVAYAAINGSLGAMSAIGNANNKKLLTIMGAQGPMPPWEFMGGVIGQAALSLQIDPARPMQTLVVQGILPEIARSRFTREERDILLHDGIATHKVDAGGNVLIERMITTFKSNSFGDPDTSFLDLNSVATLSFLRFDFRSRIATKYPRHKLANDGTRFAPGQAVVTPSVVRAEAISIFRDWEFLGLVENADQFKRDLIVERNAQDPNRLDALLPTDLINQLRIVGAQIQFLL